jgi:response regulator NasT
MKPIKPRWRVLVIDDHAPSRAAVGEAVTAEGGQVVGNGSHVGDAVHLVEMHRPDVAVIAVGLTDGDGVEAARQVMASRPCALVLLTSRTGPDVAGRAVEAGVLGFLVKPLRHEELGPALDLAVSRFRDFEAVRRENRDLKRRLESRKLVDRAKALLIQKMGMTEPEAHRRIQKTAMDTRRTMADVAQSLLGEDLGGLSATK